MCRDHNHVFFVLKDCGERESFSVPAGAGLEPQEQHQPDHDRLGQLRGAALSSFQQSAGSKKLSLEHVNIYLSKDVRPLLLQKVA